ncbi:uncharacterized protein LOC141813035 [Curcuma longa]|uniref:uncharacterized protein LOC141813035 n=1 Tax=Curcuma longa TaxID=136217 RepID=UPI003D9EC3CE
MGICSSCEATAVAAAAGGGGAAATTAKLVLLDGRLQEFPRPVKAGHVLQKQPSCFLCSADDMEFDDYVSAVDAEDELQLGQLYFLLPVSMLRRRLHGDEMAALAVKASAALMSSGGAGGCHCRALVFPEAGARLAVAAGAAELQRWRRRRSGGRRGGGKGRDFKSALSGIPE